MQSSRLQYLWGQGTRGLLLAIFPLYQAPPLRPQRARQRVTFGDVNTGCPLRVPVSTFSHRVPAHMAHRWCPASRRMQKQKSQYLALRFESLLVGTF